jgi:hypothetical protein
MQRMELDYVSFGHIIKDKGFNTCILSPKVLLE